MNVDIHDYETTKLESRRITVNSSKVSQHPLLVESSVVVVLAQLTRAK